MPKIGDCRLQTNMIQIKYRTMSEWKTFAILGLLLSVCVCMGACVFTQIKIREWWAHVNNCCLYPIILSFFPLSLFIFMFMHYYTYNAHAYLTQSIDRFVSLFLFSFVLFLICNEIYFHWRCFIWAFERNISIETFWLSFIFDSRFE